LANCENIEWEAFVDKKIIVILISASILAGCMTAPVRFNTQSGKPEVTIYGTTKKKVSEAIINREISKGWDLKSQSDSLLIFAQKNTSFGAQLLFGSKYDTVPESRITFTLIENNDGIRVLLKAELVTNPGSAFEKVTDMTSNADVSSQSQIVLEEIKAGLEKLSP
jgi:hypothetical protein